MHRRLYQSLPVGPDFNWSPKKYYNNGIKSIRPRTNSFMPTRPRTEITQNHSNITSKCVLFLNEAFKVIWK